MTPTPALLGSVGILLCMGACLPCDPDRAGTVCTVVGTGEIGFGDGGGDAIDAILNIPQDLVATPDGALWILDFNNYLLRAVEPDGTIRTIAGVGLVGDSPPPDQTAVPAAEAEFNHTTDLALADGYLYLAAWHNSRVKRIHLETMELENFAGIGRRTLYTGDEGPALEAALDLPSSVTPDPDGGLAIMDQANQVVRRVDADGVIHRIVGKCVVDRDVACEIGEEPVACPDNNKFVCGDPTTECSKPCTPAYGGDGGECLEARLAEPFGQLADPAGRIAYDLEGALLFADSDNNRIRRVSPDGIVTTVAGTGEAGYSGDGGPGTDAMLNHPVDVEVAADGTVWFTDVDNHCVRTLDEDGVIETAVGQCDSAREEGDIDFGGDGGPPTEAILDRPYGIELGQGRLWVADSYNGRIRVVNVDP